MRKTGATFKMDLAVYLDGHLKIPHLWPGQNPPATGRFQFTNLL
ncbi:conserved hypothetical protein [delta proteobacterium NaphS2]|nr:conserved hypothetical protein [delta proteobacterium NaphS2]